MQSPRLLLQAALAVGTGIAALVSSAPTRAYTETVLHVFSGGSDGEYPAGNLIMDQNGNLFGTTRFGGGACKKSFGCGTVFKLTPDGTETVLHTFASGRDGAFPFGGLVEDQDGSLYGTTSEYGGCCGTLFEVTQEGVHTILHAFEGGDDGGTPYAGPISDRQGNLYGTTTSTVFEFSSERVYTVRYTFQGGAGGYDVQAPLVADSAGNLFGATLLGGKTRCVGRTSCGTVFKLASDGTETVLYAFRGRHDGWAPSGGLTLDTSGNLYGTTGLGGGSGCEGYGCGTVIELAANGTETVLSRFNHAGGPLGPEGGVIQDQFGNLFGTTYGGGTGGCGTVFETVPGRSAKALYSFTCGKDGATPMAGLLMDQSGNLYGTTSGGGNGSGDGGDGVIFELKK